MPDPFLTLNGASLERLTRADDNLLDADTAHIAQSKGEWGNSGGTDGGVLTPSELSKFGPNVLRITMNTDGAGNFGTATGARTPLQPGPFTYSCYLNGIPGRTTQTVSLRINPRDGGDAGLGALIGPAQPLIEGVNHYVFQSTAPALTEQCWLELSFANMFDLDQMDLSATILRQDTDPTFVPSINIVGDIDLRADVAPVVWSGPDWQAMIQTRVLVDGYFMWLDRQHPAGTASLRVAYGDGITDRSWTSPTFAKAAAERGQVRAILDVSAGEWEAFVDEASIGTFSVAPGPGTSVSTLFVGDDGGGGQRLAADVFSVELRDGIDGPVVYRMDAADVLAAI